MLHGSDFVGVENSEMATKECRGSGSDNDEQPREKNVLKGYLS